MDCLSILTTGISKNGEIPAQNGLSKKCASFLENSDCRQCLPNLAPSANTARYSNWHLPSLAADARLVSCQDTGSKFYCVKLCKLSFYRLTSLSPPEFRSSCSQCFVQFSSCSRCHACLHNVQPLLVSNHLFATFVSPHFPIATILNAYFVRAFSPWQIAFDEFCCNVATIKKCYTLVAIRFLWTASVPRGFWSTLVSFRLRRLSNYYFSLQTHAPK